MEEIDDWDDHKGLDVEDAEFLDDLERVLCEELRFNGSVAHAMNLPGALNPCLHLDGLGCIGLPLNNREAREIIRQSVSTQNSDGQDVIWSFPGTKIRFDNPEWETWINDTIGPALNVALDVKVPRSDLQYRLKSLTIRGPHTKSIEFSREICDDPQQYGTLSVILPSHHVGGAVHIMHDGATKTFNIAGHSAASTTAIATYNAVSKKLDPIHSGYVACLCYELRFLGRPESIPRLPDLGGAALQLLRVFESWRHWLDVGEEDAEDSDVEDDETPDCVACLFEHTYDDATANFNAMSLRGSDRLMLEHIAPLAKTYGFDLHLAHVTYQESGHTSFKSVRRSGRGCPCGGCSEDMISSCDEDAADWNDVDVNKLEMTEGVESTRLDLSILALDGMPMQMSGATVESMKRPDDDMYYRSRGGEHFINGSLDDGDKKPSLERERRTWGTLTYTYKRNALIITPETSLTVDFTLGDVREFACVALKSSSSEAPTTEEQRLVEALLAWLTKDQSLQAATAASVKDVAKVLQDSAERWNSTDLFVKTLEACGLSRCMMVVGVDGLLSGYRAFEWDNLKAVFSDILSKMASISLCAQLIDGVILSAAGQLDSDVVCWCERQKELALDKFQQLAVTEIDWIMKVVQCKLDPTDFLRTVLIPRLHSVQPYKIKFWARLLEYIDKCPSESPAWTGAEHSGIIRACLGRIASGMSPYRTTKPRNKTKTSAHRTNATNTSTPTIDPIISVLELGTRFGCLEVCLPLLDRMWLQREEQRKLHPQQPPSVYYSALVPEVEKLLKNKLELSQSLGSFFSQAASDLLSSTSTLTAVLRTALLRSKDAITILATYLTPDCVKTLAKSQASLLKDLTLFISENLRSQADSPESSQTLQGTLKLCLAGIIGNFTLIPTHSYYNYSRVNAGIQLLTHCFTLQLSSEVNQVLARFLAVPKSNEPKYIQDGLVPFLKALPEFLHTQGLSLLDAPFSTFAAEVAKKLVRHDIGTRPPHVVPLRELLAVGCGCVDCRTSLVPFLTNELPKVDIHGAVTTRLHVERQLMSAKKWGFTWKTISSYTLQVVKPQRMIEAGKWAGAQARGYAFLDLLGDHEQQRRNLGSDYAWVAGTIAGTATPPALPVKTEAHGTKRLPGPSASDESSKKPRLS